MTYLNGSGDKPLCSVETSQIRMVSASQRCQATMTYLVRTVGNTNPRPAHTQESNRSEARALEHNHKGNNHDHTQQQSPQPLHLQSHTQTTTRTRQPLHNLWQRSRHNRPHHRNRPLPKPHRRQHPGKLPGHVSQLQLQKRPTLLNSQNSRQNPKPNRNHAE